MYKFLFDIDPLVHSDPFSRVMKQAKEGRYSVQAYDDATASAAVVAFSYVIITSPSLFLRPSSDSDAPSFICAAPRVLYPHACNVQFRWCMHPPLTMRFRGGMSSQKYEP